MKLQKSKKKNLTTIEEPETPKHPYWKEIGLESEEKEKNDLNRTGFKQKKNYKTGAIAPIVRHHGDLKFTGGVESLDKLEKDKQTWILDNYKKNGFKTPNAYFSFLKETGH